MSEATRVTWFRRMAEATTEYMAVGFVSLMMLISTLRVLGILG